MIHADFQILQMKNWDLLRAYFQSGNADMAYVMSPLALDMFHNKPNFRWVSLMHRDGNALAINELLAKKINLAANRKDRKPDNQVATALKLEYQNKGAPVEVAMPHLLSTHTVVLYEYLKKHGLSFSFTPDGKSEVLAIAIAPDRKSVV